MYVTLPTFLMKYKNLKLFSTKTLITIVLVFQTFSNSLAALIYLIFWHVICKITHCSSQFGG